MAEDDDIAAVAAAGDHVDDTPGRDLRQDLGDLYQAPLLAVPLCVQTAWRTPL